jgi:hypothetical protein
MIDSSFHSLAHSEKVRRRGIYHGRKMSPNLQATESLFWFDLFTPIHHHYHLPNRTRHFEAMIPTSPRSLSDSRQDERGYHRLLLLHHRDFEWSPPGTDSDSPPPSPRPYRWSNHNNYRHHPRASRCMDSSYRERPRHLRHRLDRPHPESLCGGFCSDDINFHTTNTAMPRGVPFSSLPAPLPLESVPGRSSPIVTAAMSPIRSNRRAFHHKQPNYWHKRETGATSTSTARAKATTRLLGRTKGMGIAASASSREASVLAALDLPPIPLLSSSSSSSSRNNKIYVRIKRLNSEKANKTTTTDTDGRDRFRFRSDQSISVPGLRTRTTHHSLTHDQNSKTKGRNQSLSLSNGIPLSSSVCGWNPSKGGTRDPTGDTAIIGFNPNDHDDGDAEARFDDESLSGLPSFPEYYHRTFAESNIFYNTEHHSRPYLQHPSTDRVLMIQSLLAIETGPISWALIGERGRPPKLFVRYLATVLVEGVRVYLEHNTGKEYWIKHVLFWSDLLDPRNDWWNTYEGSQYRVLAKRLHTSLHKRWGYSDLIECHESSVQKIFVRACILFAQKNSGSNSSNNDDDGTRDRCEPVG